ncbi:hypothetical protein KQX64_07185 [Rhodopseudomonas palustris]|nr:hypothetical protein KQX64_07185 [Rhodopseudomonas palustris]
MTDISAVSAVASPIWLPYLKEVSDIAALLLPIFGLLWLLIQIVVKIHTVRTNRRAAGVD